LIARAAMLEEVMRYVFLFVNLKNGHKIKFAFSILTQTWEADRRIGVTEMSVSGQTPPSWFFARQYYSIQRM